MTSASREPGRSGGHRRSSEFTVGLVADISPNLVMLAPQGVSGRRSAAVPSKVGTVASARRRCQGSHPPGACRHAAAWSRRSPRSTSPARHSGVVLRTYFWEAY